MLGLNGVWPIWTCVNWDAKCVCDSMTIATTMGATVDIVCDNRAIFHKVHIGSLTHCLIRTDMKALAIVLFALLIALQLSEHVSPGLSDN